MSSTRLKLSSSSRVAILGGGPSGALFGLFLAKFCKARNLSPEIKIYEQRDFNSPGIKGCKGCAGILSQTFLNNLQELNLSLPASLAQNQIASYTVHSPYTTISLDNARWGTQIISIYRGGGPKQKHEASPASFNEWLLREAAGCGVKVESQTVTDIELGGRARIQTRQGDAECDLAVLAAGVGSPPIRIAGLDYRPPSSQIVSQAELYLGEEKVRAFLGSSAHVFLIPHSNVVFGTLVPKGPFVSVTVLSTGQLPYQVKDFLALDLVRAVLPESFDLSCYCQPRVVLTPARNFFSDRFVAVGDAAVSRLYKDGIGSSLITARSAALAAVSAGFSADDFTIRYLPLCRQIARDNRWGKILFTLNNQAKNSRLFLLAQNRLIGDEQNNLKAPQPFTNAARGMFTGGYSYRNIAWMIFNPVSLSKLGAVLSKEILRAPFRSQAHPPRKVLVRNAKILILGSGFGGTYVLRRLLPRLNRNENIETTMISDENFFLFTPLLHEVAMGKIETRHVAFPIRKLNWKDRFTFVQDSIQRIDLAKREVVTTRNSYAFTQLVLALGATIDPPAVKSSDEIFFTLRNIHDSMLLRNHLIETFERADGERDAEERRRLLTFVVCGAGYTGIQVVSELRDFIFRSLIQYYRAIGSEDIKIILVEAEPQLLASLPSRLSNYVARQLSRKGIELLLGSRVTAVGRDNLVINDSRRIGAGNLIWVAGIRANSLIATLPVPTDQLGRVKVDRYLEVPEYPGVSALGDCVHFENPRTGEIVLPRAHHAVRQARVVAHNILAEIRGWDKEAYDFKNDTEIVSLGSSDAIFRYRRLEVRGFLARLIWIAGYTLLINGAYNRVRILTDWIIFLLFGRDTTLLKLKR